VTLNQAPHPLSILLVCPACGSSSNPCREAIVNYEQGVNKSRYSWDPLTTLVAIRGAEAVGTTECSECDGRNVIDAATGGWWGRDGLLGGG
jgi:hypothetical protein